MSNQNKENMKLVYVRFGKVDFPEIARVHEGIVKGNEIHLVIPKPSHSGARELLQNIGFGDFELFLVTGTPSTSTLADDGVYLENVKVVQKLEYDPNKEKIIIPAPPEPPMSKQVSKKAQRRAEKKVLTKNLEKSYDSEGFWGLMYWYFRIDLNPIKSFFRGDITLKQLIL